MRAPLFTARFPGPTPLQARDLAHMLVAKRVDGNLVSVDNLGICNPTHTHFLGSRAFCCTPRAAQVFRSPARPASLCSLGGT